MSKPPESALDHWIGTEGQTVVDFRAKLPHLVEKLGNGEITKEGFLTGLRGDGQDFRTFEPEADETTPWKYIVERKKGVLQVSSRQVGMEIPQVTGRFGLRDGELTVRVKARFLSVNAAVAKFQPVKGGVLYSAQGIDFTRKQVGESLLKLFMGGLKAA